MKGAPFQPEMKMIIGSASLGVVEDRRLTGDADGLQGVVEEADLAVEQEAPAVAEDDEGRHPGGEDQRRGEPADRAVAIEKERQRKAERDLDDDGADGPGDGAQEGAPEGGVLEELDVVDEPAPDRGRVPQQVPVLEGEPEAVGRAARRRSGRRR